MSPPAIAVTAVAVLGGAVILAAAGAVMYTQGGREHVYDWCSEAHTRSAQAIEVAAQKAEEMISEGKRRAGEEGRRAGETCSGVHKRAEEVCATAGMMAGEAIASARTSIYCLFDQAKKQTTSRDREMGVNTDANASANAEKNSIPDASADELSGRSSGHFPHHPSMPAGEEGGLRHRSHAPDQAQPPNYSEAEAIAIMHAHIDSVDEQAQEQERERIIEEHSYLSAIQQENARKLREIQRERAELEVADALLQAKRRSYQEDLEAFSARSTASLHSLHSLNRSDSRSDSDSLTASLPAPPSELSSISPDSSSILLPRGDAPEILYDASADAFDLASSDGEIPPPPLSATPWDGLPLRSSSPSAPSPAICIPIRSLPSEPETRSSHSGWVDVDDHESLQ